MSAARPLGLLEAPNSRRVLLPRTMPGTTARNDLPEFRPYTYNGTGEDTLTAFLDDLDDEHAPTRMGAPVFKTCGTSAAYRRHFRNGEKPCPECIAAEARRTADYRAAKRGAA